MQIGEFKSLEEVSAFSVRPSFPMVLSSSQASRIEAGFCRNSARGEPKDGREAPSIADQVICATCFSGPEWLSGCVGEVVPKGRASGSRLLLEAQAENLERLQRFQIRFSRGRPRPAWFLFLLRSLLESAEGPTLSAESSNPKRRSQHRMGGGDGRVKKR